MGTPRQSSPLSRFAAAASCSSSRALSAPVLGGRMLWSAPVIATPASLLDFDADFLSRTQIGSLTNPWQDSDLWMIFVVVKIYSSATMGKGNKAEEGAPAWLCEVEDIKQRMDEMQLQINANAKKLYEQMQENAARV
ncbi:hypothetical protein GUJ93_ZPchr0004g38732 [Zizania palustris]|uniref:Uncharacterized protein n=1 Tax=Zizania palustris TaxID=103762 RepID=A0A8J5RB91_ZIZPA|nr:hypothetical protein GUJ93_ZPchr0329g2895 [Zizania palustris]KAG8065866.1 hypothetical protein GUJ93_ZPchr0004g38732 [Zizania palustris]